MSATVVLAVAMPEGSGAAGCGSMSLLAVDWGVGGGHHCGVKNE